MHHAWLIVGLVFTTQFVANSVGVYALSVLMGPLQRDLDASRTAVSAILLTLAWAGAAMGPLMGRAVARFPIHRIMAAGCLTMALGFFATARVDTILGVQIGYAIAVAVGMGTLSGVPASALIVNWFEGRRALALGIAGIGISAAGALMTPVTAIWVETLGWRGTFELWGWISLGLVPIVWWLATTHPRDRGLEPYGAGEPAAQPPATTASVPSAGELLRDPNLWAIGIAAGFAFLSATAVLAHLITLGTDAGFDALDAAFLVSTVAAAAMFAKLLFGALAGWIGERPAFGVALGFEVVGLLGLAELRGDYRALLAAAAVFGLGMGGITPLLAALLARVFGPVQFGMAMGLAAPILALSQSVGAPILGYVYDVQGDYGPGLWLLAALMIVPAAALWLMRPPREMPLPAPGLP